MNIIKRWLTSISTYVVNQYKEHKRQNIFTAVLKTCPKDNKVDWHKTILTNVFWSLKYNKQPSDSELSLILKLNKLTIDKILPIRHIVGFQAMTAPVNLVYVLRYRKGDEQEEEANLRNLHLDVVSHAVEASSQQLNAQLSIHAIEDLKKLHSVKDPEQEIVEALSSEIAIEIVNIVIKDIKQLANSNKTFTSGSANSLIFDLNRASSEIGFRTRRGRGNVILTTPVGVSVLQTMNAKGIEFVPSTDKGNDNAIKHAGDLKEQFRDNVIFKVYCVTHDVSDVEDRVDFFVGYKGGNGDVDAGYIYAPYTPVMTLATTINKTTFNPMMRFYTRFGKCVLTPSEYDGIPTDAKFYYARVTHKLSSKKEEEVEKPKAPEGRVMVGHA